MKETLLIAIKCTAPDGLFDGDFDDLSPEHQELFKGQDRVICDAGTLGKWCLDCRFVEYEYREDYDSDN